MASAPRSFAEPGQLDRLKKYHGDKAAWVLSAWVDTAVAGLRRLEARRRAARVKCPVLALHGEVDEYGSAAHPEIIARLTGGKQALLENCGHVPHREQAHIVLDTAGQWLRGAVPG